MQLTTICIQEIEAAINYYRAEDPGIPDEYTICSKVRALAEVYGQMIFGQVSVIAIESLSQLQGQLIEDFRVVQCDEVARGHVVAQHSA